MGKYQHFDFNSENYAIVSILRSAESMIHSIPLKEEDNIIFGKILI